MDSIIDVFNIQFNLFQSSTYSQSDHHLPYHIIKRCCPDMYHKNYRWNSTSSKHRERNSKNLIVLVLIALFKIFYYFNTLSSLPISFGANLKKKHSRIHHKVSFIITFLTQDNTQNLRFMLKKRKNIKIYFYHSGFVAH